MVLASLNLRARKKRKNRRVDNCAVNMVETNGIRTRRNAAKSLNRGVGTD